MEQITLERDDTSAKLGMWVFIFTEILLFGGLFLVYAIMRHRYPEEFHVASRQLNTFIGALNTLVLLTSSMTVAMSITAVQKKDKRMANVLLLLTILCACIFLVNKYFEWGHKIQLTLYPGSELMIAIETWVHHVFSVSIFL